MHLEGTQKTVISPLVYCLFLGSAIELKNDLCLALRNKQIGRMFNYIPGQSDKTCLNAQDNVLNDPVSILRIIFGFQIIPENPGEALPEEGGKSPF